MKNPNTLLDSIDLDLGSGVAGQVQCSMKRSNPSNLRLLCLDHTTFLLQLLFVILLYGLFSLSSLPPGV